MLRSHRSTGGGFVTCYGGLPPRFFPTPQGVPSVSPAVSLHLPLPLRVPIPHHLPRRFIRPAAHFLECVAHQRIPRNFIVSALCRARTHTHHTLFSFLLCSRVDDSSIIHVISADSRRLNSSRTLLIFSFPRTFPHRRSDAAVSLRSPHLLSLSRTHRHTTRALLCQGSPFAQPLLVPLAGPHLHSTLTSSCSSLSFAFSLSLSRADSSRLQGQSVSL